MPARRQPGPGTIDRTTGLDPRHAGDPGGPRGVHLRPAGVRRTATDPRSLPTVQLGPRRLRAGGDRPSRHRPVLYLRRVLAAGVVRAPAGRLLRGGGRRAALQPAAAWSLRP